MAISLTKGEAGCPARKDPLGAVGFGLDDDPSQPQSSDRRHKPILAKFPGTFDGLAIGTDKSNPLEIIAEGAQAVVVLAVHIVGNGATHGHQLRARGDRQNHELKTRVQRL